MAEKNINKERVLSFSTALGIIAICWGLYTGVLDRGTSAGAFNEKILYFDRALMKTEVAIEAVSKELKEKAASDQATRIDIVKLQALYEQIANETRESRKIIEEIRARQFKDINR